MRVRRRFAVAVRRWACAWACVALAGCGGDGHPPVARIVFTPDWLPVADDYRTDVILDGTASGNDAEDPTGARPLAYAWSIDDPHLQVVEGTPAAAKLTVRLAANGPTTVVLTVSDSGGTGRATVHVGVTVPAGM